MKLSIKDKAIAASEIYEAKDSKKVQQSSWSHLSTSALDFKKAVSLNAVIRIIDS